jgi:orotate phosphoribosyltransferase
VGVVVGLDRQERGLGDTTESAVQQVQKMHSIPVVAVASLANLVALVEEVRRSGGSLPGYDVAAVAELLSSIQKYRTEYGVC